MQKITFNKLPNLKNLMTAAKDLTHVGTLAVTSENFTYLDIDDEYIHRLFPLLKSRYPQIEKAKYFGHPKLVGAHISVIYPEEKIIIEPIELGKKYNFQTTEMVTADLGPKRYYALAITAPTLVALRKKHGLNEMLNLKGYFINLHITIGTATLK